MFETHILSYIIFTPLVGALILLLLRNDTLAKSVSIFFAGLTFVFSVILYFLFDVSKPAFQFVEYVPWIHSLHVAYHLGIDGISLLLIILTTFLTLVALITSWSSINKKVRSFNFFVLLLEVGMLGVFSSLDLFLFYIFWEAMLVPMYFIIGSYGGPRPSDNARAISFYTPHPPPLSAAPPCHLLSAPPPPRHTAPF